MNEQTRLMIDSLATKLGTTAELLWSALIRQAPFEALGDLMMLAIEGICAWLMIKWYRSIRENGQDDIVFFPYGICALILAGLVVISLQDVPTTFAGFFNPEYWALKEVLSLISKGHP